MNRKTLDRSIAFILGNIQLIMLMMTFVLNGTKEVFAKNSKEGYGFYLVAFFVFVALMVSNFLD